MWKRLLLGLLALVLAVAYGVVATVGFIDDAGTAGRWIKGSGHWLPTVVVAAIATTALWPEISRNVLGKLHPASSPRNADERIGDVIDQGYEIRAIIEDNNRPLPETRYQQWRAAVKRELTDIVSDDVAQYWDKFHRRPAVGFTGLLASNRKRAWDEVTVKIEELERIRKGLQLT